MSGGLSNGAHLRTRRRALGLSQAELAARLGVQQRTISEWETGTVSIQHVRMLFRALNDVADELAAETDADRRRARSERVLAWAIEDNPE